MKPIHLDFTTFHGAALSLENKELEIRGLPLSRLLNLSQLVEAMVLMEDLQYEFGSTPDWIPYRDALGKTALAQYSLDKGFPIKQCSEQIDLDEKMISECVARALDDVYHVPVEHILWAVSFRGGTYSQFQFTSDAENPMLKKYMTIALDRGPKVVEKQYKRAIAYLDSQEIGKLGLHVLIRINLIKSYFENTGTAHYFPHYSRQPLIISSFSRQKDVHEWNLNNLREIRDRQLKKNEPERSRDPLERSLSPIFLACMNKAGKPLDVIANALSLRNEASAKAYRAEISAIFDEEPVDESDIQLYKTRLSLAISNLDEFLFEQGTKEEYQRTWLVKAAGFPIGWQFVKTKSFKTKRFPGDRSKTFLSDVLRQSLGVLDSVETIQKVFGVNVDFDSKLMSSATPTL